MPAYVMVEVSYHYNKEKEKKEYQKLTPATVAAFDGKFIVRGGQTITLEGDWNPKRIVVIEFPNVERAHEWWNSELYSKAKVIRQQAENTKMIIVEGV